MPETFEPLRPSRLLVALDKRAAFPFTLFAPQEIL
jgi:hypothetical protein